MICASINVFISFARQLRTPLTRGVLACAIIALAGAPYPTLAAGAYDLVLPPREEIDDRVREQVRERMLEETRARIRARAAQAAEEAIVNQVEDAIADNIENRTSGNLLQARPEVFEKETELEPEKSERLKPEPDVADRVTDRLIEARLAQIGLAIEPALSLMTDRAGQAALSHQWLVMTDAETLDLITSAGYEVSDIEMLEGLGYVMGTISAPSTFDPATGFPELHILETTELAVDMNHVYLPQELSEELSQDNKVPSTFQFNLPADRSQWQQIGMIDSSINRAHPAFTQARIFEKQFTPSGFNRAGDHGTAIASLLVGSGENFEGFVPNSRLYNGVIFARDPQGRVFSTTAAIVKALNWMAENKVNLVNMSLAGPDNVILERAVKRACDRGMTLVTAAGNAGPASAPLFPAAYPCTIAVTAVDRNDAVYHRANRGEHIDFAVPGVDIFHATGEQRWMRSSGTSYAAAIMSGLIATLLPEVPTSPAEIRQEFTTWASDHGRAGTDPVYGRGVIRGHPGSTGFHTSASADRHAGETRLTQD